MKKNKPAAANKAPGVVKPVAKQQPVKNENPPQGYKNWVIALCVLIPVAAIYIYGKTLNYPLDKLDETPIFTCMQQFNSTHTSIFQSVYYDAFFGGTSDVFFYRPMQNISYLLDVSMWGFVPYGVHLTNLILFIGIAYTLLYLLTLFDVSLIFSSLIAFLFCCHPLYATAVVWIPSRGDLLSTLFSMLSMVCFIRYYKGSQSKFFIGSLVFFLLGVFSKESVIGLPVIFALYLFIKDKTFYKSKQNLVAVFSLLAISVLYLAVRKIISLSFNGTTGWFTITNFFANWRTIPEAVAKSIIPISLSPMPSFSVPVTVIGLLLLAGIVWLAYKFNNKLPFLFLGLVWFVFFLSPTMFFQHKFGAHSYKYLEHRILMPSIGLMLIIGMSAEYFLSKYRQQALVAGAVIGLVFIGYTANYANIFENRFTYYSRVLDENPDDILAHSNLANCYFRVDKFDSAIYQASEAIRVYPHFSLALVNRSKIYAKLGYNDKAVADIDTMLTTDSSDFDLYAMRGNYENALGRYPDAMRDFNKSLQLKPNNADAMTNKGTVYDKLNLKDSALVCYKKAMQIDPTVPWPYINAALLETNKQEFKEAIADFDQAIKLKPDYWDVYLNRGIDYYYMKDYNKAEADYKFYLTKVPNNGLALNNLGILKINMGQAQEGCEYLRKAAQAGNANAAENVKIYCK